MTGQLTTWHARIELMPSSPLVDQVCARIVLTCQTNRCSAPFLYLEPHSVMVLENYGPLCTLKRWQHSGKAKCNRTGTVHVSGVSAKHITTVNPAVFVVENSHTYCYTSSMHMRLLTVHCSAQSPPGCQRPSICKPFPFLKSQSQWLSGHQKQQQVVSRMAQANDHTFSRHFDRQCERSRKDTG